MVTIGDLMGKLIDKASLSPRSESHDTYQLHEDKLFTVMSHQFPEQLGTGINLMLDLAGAQSITLETWSKFISTFAPEEVCVDIIFVM